LVINVVISFDPYPYNPSPGGGVRLPDAVRARFQDFIDRYI